jgi:predicted GIY-YIG superfamily endonuclease
MSWNVYIIYNGSCSYVGMTNNLEQRIRKHNQEICGGAKYTRKVGKGWKYMVQIKNFKCKTDALKFEWALKHCAPRNFRGIYSRIYKLEILLNRERWTSKAPESYGYELEVVFMAPEFILEEIEVPDYINMYVEVV